MMERDGNWWIRANQGHSVPTVQTECLLETIDPSSLYQMDVIHGTKKELWPILSQQGLSKMNRRHVHLASGLDATSGIRPSSTLRIYIDTNAAMSLGIRFYQSSNGVILTEQDIPASCFRRVVQRRKSEWIAID